MEQLWGILGIVLFVAILVLWIWALIDILKSSFRNQTDKVIWLLVVLALNGLGALLYYWIGRHQK